MDLNTKHTASFAEPDHLDKAILQTLIYFDIFQYPLNASEVTRNCSHPNLSTLEVAQRLKAMTEKGWLNQAEGFFFIGEEDGRVARRLQGNALASERLVKARQVSRFIARFPYVRAVMLSGSLSKDYMEPESDIDYFIVTQPGRLWIARTFLILYKKVVLLNSHKNFCVNYFVDTEHLEIEDKNQFTATEVAFLLPTIGAGLYADFRKSNAWANEFYPNFAPRPVDDCPNVKPRGVQKFLEWILNGRLGESIDGWFMKRTLKRWQQKFPDLPKPVFDVAMRSRRYVSKHHPQAYQRRVLGKIEEKEVWFSNTFNIKW